MKRYSEEEIEEFVEVARELGLSGAIKHLGYPSARSTADYWLKQRHITIEVDVLRRKAAETKNFYTEQDRLMLLDTLIGRIFERLHSDELEPADLLKLTSAAKQTIETWRLVSGQSTQNFQVDSMDSRINELLRQFKLSREEALTKANQQLLSSLGTKELSSSNTQSVEHAELSHTPETPYTDPPSTHPTESPST